MADDVVLNPGGGGDTIAADDVGGIKHQRVKIQYGTEGSATDVSGVKPLPTKSVGAQLDAFHRLRVANPVTVWDSQFQYNLQPLFYAQTVTTNGTITHNADYACADLAITTEDGSSAQLQTYEHFRYQPGKSQLLYITFIPSAGESGVKQRAGQYNDSNGFFFEKNGTTASVVMRSSVSGTVTDTAILQSEWNLDVLDGTGTSGKTLDTSNVQILIIDYQALYAGRIRFGFDIDGEVIIVHEILIANRQATPSVTTANLPIRWEIINDGGTTAAHTLHAICTSLQSEGGIEHQSGLPFSIGREGATAANNTEEVLIAIRPKATLNSIEFRGKIDALRTSILVTTSNCRWRIRYAPTSYTSPSWTSVDDQSGVEYDVSSTAVSGGTIIDQGFVPAGGGGGPSAVSISGGIVDVLSKLPFTLDPDGTQRISIALTIEGVGGSTTVDGNLTWDEIR